MRLRRPSRETLSLWLLVFIWAANFSVVKAALAEFHPLAFNALRFLVASVALLAFLRGTHARLGFEPRHWRGLVALGLLGNTVYQILFIYGLDWTLAGNASLLLSTTPVFVMLLSTGLRHEEPGPAAWVGVALSVAGIALVVLGGAKAVRFGTATLRGDATMLVAAVAWSAYTVGSSGLVRRYGALPVTAATLWIGTAGLLAVSLPALAAQDWSRVRPAAWAALIFSGLLSIAVAYVLWYASVERVGSSRTAVISNTIPVAALLIAWVTLGERPTWLHPAGTAAILGGVALVRKVRAGPAAEGRAREVATPPQGE
ncbi:MAG TPA: DMT family transporter [Gemmatimonadota bacterium]